MRIVFYVAVGLAAAAITFVIAWATWKLGMRYRLYPAIRERDVHTTPTPRLGGAALFLGVCVALGVASQFDEFALVFADPQRVFAILGASLLIVVVGIIDDLYDIDWLLKLAAQIMCGVILSWGGVQLLTIPSPFEGILYGPGPFVSLVLTVLVVVLVMNAVNFIDGLDGLVAGVAIIGSASFFVYSYVMQANQRTDYFNLAALLTVVIGGACVGFLPFNWRREKRGRLVSSAKLFMGDSGALLVGLLMATSAITVTGSIDPKSVSAIEVFSGIMPILLPFAILLVPLLDFALAVLRRLLAGKSPFTADRKHLHHRLLDMGHSHLQAVFIFYAWTFVVAVGCVLPVLPVPGPDPDRIGGRAALTFLIVGFLVCAVLTALPLTRRKRVETAVQVASADTAPGIERFDPLDAASNALPLDTPDPEAAEKALARAKESRP